MTCADRPRGVAQNSCWPGGHARPSTNSVPLPFGDLHSTRMHTHPSVCMHLMALCSIRRTHPAGDARSRGARQVTAQQLRDDLLSMLVAGHETTGSVLTWTMYLLAQSPEAMAKVRLFLGNSTPKTPELKTP